MKELIELDTDVLIKNRIARYKNIGHYDEVKA
jgi:hypothetical protein